MFGVLKLYWLMAFERFNKKIKNLVGNKNHPEKSVANAMIRDAGNVTMTPFTTYHANRIFTHQPKQLRVFNSGQRRRYLTPS